MSDRQTLLLLPIISLLIIALSVGTKELISISTLFAVLMLCPQYLVLYVASLFIKSESNTKTLKVIGVLFFTINTIFVIGKFGMGIPILSLSELFLSFCVIFIILIDRVLSKSK